MNPRDRRHSSAELSPLTYAVIYDLRGPIHAYIWIKALINVMKRYAEP